MDISIDARVNLRLMPTGRRRHAVRRVRVLAEAKQLTELVALCDTALSHDEGTANLQRSRAEALRRKQLESEGAKTRLSAAMRLDHQIDRALSAIDAKLAAEVAAADADSVETKSVTALRVELFPSGVNALTAASHAEAREAVADFLARAKEKQTQLVEYGAGRLLARLEQLHGDFSAELARETAEPVGADQIRKATRRGNQLLKRIVVSILNETGDDESAQQMAQRRELLAPILEQDAVMFQFNRQNRKPSDVEPETGAEVEAEDEG